MGYINLKRKEYESIEMAFRNIDYAIFRLDEVEKIAKKYNDTELLNYIRSIKPVLEEISHKLRRLTFKYIRR